MSWPLISAQEALGRLHAGARGLDVRSEGEFSQGHLPSFVNIPVLNNLHRHLVGLTYKQRGPSVAIKLGHELVDPLRGELVERWTEALASFDPKQRLVVCWRGGLRSSSTADALAAAGVDGVRVDGGYKEIRRELLGACANPPPLLNLTGPTGSGKTELLREFEGALDLEGLANHRGSAFGKWIDDPQPAQATFENRIGFAVHARGGPVLIEDESTMVGQLLVPGGIRARLVDAPTVVLEVDIEERARRSFEDYVATPVRRFGIERVRAYLLSAVAAVERKLGGLRTREISALITRAFDDEVPRFAAFAAPITRLLLEYYDPMYAHGVRRHARPVLCRGPRDEVRAFLKHHIGSK